MKRLFFLGLAWFGIALGAGAATVEWPLEAEGVEICLPLEPSPAEAFAAEELQSGLRKMSGATLPIRKGEPTPGRKVIYVGRHPASEALWKELADPDHHRIEAGEEAIRIVGGYRPPVADGEEVYYNEWGVNYGVFELLEEQGFRWLRPGDAGEEVPKSRVLRAASGVREFKPAFPLRWGVALYATSSLRTATPEESQAAVLWAFRNRCNVLRGNDPRYGGGLRIGGGGHSYHQLVPEKLFAKHPEFFPLIDGKRKAKGQICHSNPELQEFFAKAVVEAAKRRPGLYMTSIDPNDGAGWCECGPCRAMDDPAVKSGRGGGLSMSSRVAAFNNIIAKKVEPELPGLRLYSLAYAQYLEPPTRVEKLEPSLVVGLAPFAGAFSDYSRPLRDPESLPNRRFLDSIKGFHKLGTTMYAREYLSHYAWPGPLPLLWVMQDRFRVYRDFDFIGAYSETHPCWGPQGMVLHFYLKLLWNPDLDLDTAIADYCEKAYGPAAAPMLRYHQKIEARGKGGPYFGSGGSQAIGLFTPEFLAALAEDVAEARKLAAGAEPYEWRVETVLKGYEFAQLYRAAVTELGTGNVAQARAALEALETFYREESASGEIFNKGEGSRRGADGKPQPPGFLRNLRTDLARIDTLEKTFRNPRLLQQLTARWKFQPDAKDEGVSLEWNAVELDDAGWAPLSSETPWQHQGFSGFHGTGWYRRKFPTPVVEPGQKVMLIFDGVDGDATFWLNGVEVGRRDLVDPVDGRNRWNEPFALDITDGLKPGAANTLAVRVRKESGNGGLYRSVRLVRADP